MNALRLAVLAAQKKQGFVGMDYRMVVLAVIAEKTGDPLPFKGGDPDGSKHHYWRSRIQYIPHPNRPYGPPMSPEELLVDAEREFLH